MGNEKLTTLARRLRPFFMQQVADLVIGGSLVEEGPDIDLVTTATGVQVGRGGDTILLFDSGGNPLAEYAATGAGFAAALAAATSGDVVDIPAVTITGGPWTVASGVGVKGLGPYQSVLSGVLNNTGGKIDSVGIDGTAAIQATMSSGWITNTYIHTTGATGLVQTGGNLFYSDIITDSSGPSLIISGQANAFFCNIGYGGARVTLDDNYYLFGCVLTSEFYDSCCELEKGVVSHCLANSKAGKIGYEKTTADAGTLMSCSSNTTGTDVVVTAGTLSVYCCAFDSTTGTITWVSSPPVSTRKGTAVAAFGDSVTVGTGASDAAHRYTNLVAAEFTWALTNAGVGSTQILDWIDAIYGTAPSDSAQTIALVGYNDMRHGGTDATILSTFKDALWSIAAWLTIPDDTKIKGQSADVTCVGSWSNSTYYGGSLGKYTSTNGDTATFVVFGRTAYIGLTALDSGGGSFSITVDGVSAGTFTCTGAAVAVSTRNYGPKLVRVTGLDSGPHTVVLTHTGTGNAYLDWAGGADGASHQDGPNFWVGNCPRMTAAGYATGGADWDNGSDAAAALYNAAIRDVTYNLGSDGLAVGLADVTTFWRPEVAADIAVDNVHPTDTGHAKIAEAFYAAIDFVARPIDRLPPGASITLDSDAETVLDITGSIIGLDTQTANTVFAGPTTGAANEPTFRALVAGDLPAIALNDLSDVNTSGVGTGDIIYKSSGDWVDYPLGVGTAIANDGASIKIGDVAGGNLISISTTTGEVSLTGDATAFEDLRVEPSVRQAAGTGVPTFEKYFDDALNTSRGVFLYSFTDESVAGNEKEVFFTMQMPHAWKIGTNISFHVHFVPAATVATSDIIWGLEYIWKGIGEVYGDTTIVYSSTTLLPDDANITAGKHYLAEFSDIAPGTTASSLSSILIGRLFRNSSAGGDTYTNKVGLLYIDAHYEVDSFGSYTEYGKTTSLTDSDGITLTDSDGEELVDSAG